MPASARRPAAWPALPGDGDQPAPQPGPSLVAGVSVHEDLAAAHARARPGVGAAEPAAGGAAHDQPAAAHAGAGPVAGVALDDELAAAHRRARVRPGAAGERQAAAGHARAQARDAGQIALDAHVPRAAARDGEQLSQRRPAVAVPELEPLDLGPAQDGEPVGAERLGADRYRRRLAQRQGEAHGTSSRRWK